MVNKKQANKLLFTFGLFKIRMIAFTNPKVVEIDDTKIVVRIRHNWKTKNHLGGMYIGALAIGADIAAGLSAFIKGRESGKNPKLIFKNFNMEFFKRPESDVYFECLNGAQIDNMLEESKLTEERVTQDTVVKAFTNYYNSNKECVAEMTVGVSVKMS